MIVAASGGVILAAILVVAGDPLLGLFGTEFTAVYDVLVVLAVATVAYNISLVSGTAVFMLGEGHTVTRVLVAGAFSTVACSTLGIMVAGTMGAAVAYLLNRIGIAVVLFVLTRRSIAEMAAADEN